MLLDYIAILGLIAIVSAPIWAYMFDRWGFNNTH